MVAAYGRYEAWGAPLRNGIQGNLRREPPQYYGVAADPSTADPGPRGCWVASAVRHAHAADAAGTPPAAPSPGPALRTAACCRHIARLHRLDLVEQLEAERRAVELNREPPVRVIHHVDLLSHQAARQRRRVQHQHHPVIVQGQVVRDRPFFLPGQHLIEVIGRAQRPMQVLGIRRLSAETRGRQ